MKNRAIKRKERKLRRKRINRFFLIVCGAPNLIGVIVSIPFLYTTRGLRTFLRTDGLSLHIWAIILSCYAIISLLTYITQKNLNLKIDWFKYEILFPSIGTPFFIAFFTEVILFPLNPILKNYSFHIYMFIGLINISLYISWLCFRGKKLKQTGQ